MSALRMTALCLCAALMLCGCDKGEESSSHTGETAPRTSTTASAAPVEVKEYKYPEFLDSEDTLDMLANTVGNSFDGAAAVTKAEDVSFPRYKPILCFYGEYYTFREDGKIGILNKEGSVLLPADKYTDAVPVSAHIVKLERADDENGEQEQDLMFLNAGKGMIIDSDFDKSKITVEEFENAEGKKLCSLKIYGVQDSRRFDSITPVTAGEITSSMKYSAAYKAVSGVRKYFLLIDEYYNLTVCEGVYGKIELKAGGRTGECYILDGEHYTELYKMISSFGSTSDPSKPSKDENLDYIQITFGTDPGERTVVTVSSEGFCLRDVTTGDGAAVNKYFSAFPKETFTDLVNWVSEVASQEYASGRELLDNKE